MLLTSAATWQEFTLPVDEADVKSITIDPDGIVLKKISYSTVKSEPLSEPQGFLLQQNHPNPFSRGTGTVIPFSVQTASHVTVDVVDLLGRSRGTVTDGWYAPGEFSVTFQPGAMPSGTYLIRMRAGGRLASRVMMLE